VTDDGGEACATKSGLARFGKTVCVQARASKPPFTIASQGDVDTASCRPARFGRGWPPLHETIQRELDRRSMLLERQAPLIERAWRNQEARRLRHAARSQSSP
jgi:hypothetical protein